MVRQFIRFFQEAYSELKLATWLTRQEMMASTIVVLALTMIVALYVSLVDRVLLFLAGLVLGTR
jgi:preprotein translocase subunit SecE